MTIIKGSSSDDRLLGTDANETFEGGSGNDVIIPFGGDDILIGGPGADVYATSEGDDTYYIEGLYDQIVNIGDDDPGSDTAIVSVSFAKIPSYIESIVYEDGVIPLPYWINAFLYDNSNGNAYKAEYQKTGTFFYSFPSQPPQYILEAGQQYSDGYAELNDTQQENVRNILSNIEFFLDVTFTETEFPGNLNTLSFATLSSSREGIAAFASPPAPGSVTYLPHDVFFYDIPEYETLNLGTQGAHGAAHEIGHAIGLKHPFEGEDQLSENENQHKWTIMSYTKSENWDWLNHNFSVLDIAALQYLYGPNPNSRPGDDTYVFDSENPNFIWDGAGTDTIDASSSPDSVNIFLTPGYHGFIGRTKKYELITSPGQITVNFGTEIENLKGSAFADVLTGNHLNNVIEGLAGSDTIDGKEGIDTVVFSGNKSDYSWAMFVVDPHPESGLEPWYGWSVGEDSLRNIERLQFDDTNIALDLDGHAGEAVKTLGAFLGASGITPENVGLVLNLLDGGLSYEGLLAEANAVVFGADPDGATMVSHFYTALTGEEAPADVINQYGGMVDNGELSRVELAKLVADYEVNLTNIDLVGLRFAGVEYLLG